MPGPRSRRGVGTTMSAVLTHPWGSEHRPNLRHWLWLAPAEEAGKLSFQGMGFRKKVTQPRTLASAGHRSGFTALHRSRRLSGQSRGAVHTASLISFSEVLVR